MARYKYSDRNQMEMICIKLADQIIYDTQISTLKDYCYDINDYQPHQFLGYLYTLQNPCPLCNKNHPIKFFCFTDRKVKQESNSFIDIDVIRIICLDNLRLNISTGQKLQFNKLIY